MMIIDIFTPLIYLITRSLWRIHMVIFKIPISTAVYDVWPIAENIMMNNGVALSKYISRLHDLSRHGQHHLARNIINSKLSKPTPPTNYHGDIIRAYLLLMLGITLRKSGSFDSAKRTLGDAISRMETIGEYNGVARGMLALGDVYRADYITSQQNPQIHLDISDDLYKQAYKLLSSRSHHGVSERLLMSQILWAQAKIEIIRETPSLHGIRCLARSWKLCSQIGCLWAEEECSQIIGRFYICMGWLSGGDRWLRHALWCSIRTGNVDRLAETELLLARSCIRKGSHLLARIHIIGGKAAIDRIPQHTITNEHQLFRIKSVLDSLLYETERKRNQ